MFRILAIALIGTGLTAPLAAQDISLEPTYGNVELSAGFEHDPYAVGMDAGGETDVRKTTAPGCVGFVADAPDVDLYYEAGEYPLSIEFLSHGDTTLVINTPSGEWVCSDDSEFDLNPIVVFDVPESGLYDIWVGTQSPDELLTGALLISER